MKLRYFIKTFGCQQNKADSERIVASFEARGMISAKGYNDANYIVINTCMVRQSAEDRVYGLVRNLSKLKNENSKLKIIVTGCMVGLALRDKTGKLLKILKERMPEVDEFMPIEEVGFDFAPLRTDKTHAWIPISNGCNNFCSYCVVPFTRGREISRPFEDIIKEAIGLKNKGYKEITLLGQNVNSYGADLIKNSKFEYRNSKQIQNPNDQNSKRFKNSNLFQASDLEFQISKLKPIYVKHLGRYRIPTLFPYLLEEIAKLGFEKVDFISSNPWDFSDELIEVIAKYKNITRTIHLPVQSGDDNVLKRMNRWYTAKEYLKLIEKIRKKIPEVKFTTDIIVGFCGETDKEFQNTVNLCKKVGFEKTYIAMYSPRPMAAATKVMKDDVPYEVKKKRWKILEDLINKKNKLLNY
ncbi:MAG: MiaB/RimO family radical SAM methylthiotransferase [Patescibacteria group bacterium]|nr:MiaB/RimO family radical SAM methylthiotransferase [Patescibacteria group bacterium]